MANLEERGSVPVPDPTTLTTNAVKAAREEIEKLFAEKLHGMRELTEEKFTGVKTEFTMRDIALAAAFKAAEAAVKQQNESNTLAIDKAGTAFTKQIDGLDEKIVDLKERVSQLSSHDTRSNWTAAGGYIVGAIGVVAALGAIIAVLLRH